MGRKPIKEQRRKEVLDAMYRCLLRKPYSETSIKDIGREAGINYAMLHYYFESKEDILLSFIDGIIDHQRAMFSERLRKLQKEHLPYGELIRQVFAFINEEITTDKNLQKVFFEIWAVALYNKEVNTRLKKIYREWIDELGTIMKSGARSSPDSAHLAMAAVAFQEGIGIFSVFFNFNRKYTRMLLEEFQERIIEML